MHRVLLFTCFLASALADSKLHVINTPANVEVSQYAARVSDIAAIAQALKGDTQESVIDWLSSFGLSPSSRPASVVLLDGASYDMTSSNDVTTLPLIPDVGVPDLMEFANEMGLKVIEASTYYAMREALSNSLVLAVDVDPYEEMALIREARGTAQQAGGVYLFTEETWSGAFEAGVWLVIVLGLAIYAISAAMWNMQDTESIVYKSTSGAAKKTN